MFMTLVFALIGLFTCIWVLRKEETSSMKVVLIIFVATVGGLTGTILSACIPAPGGYSGNLEFVEAFEVQPINFGGDEDEFVFKVENDDFMCMKVKYIINDSEDGMERALAIYNIGRSEVTIAESSNVETPTMFKYTEKHKLHFWSLWARKKERDGYKLMLPQN